ncbi:MAG: hypothetical protein QM723_16915 [Myxococcaceae bacterium]
MSRAALSLLLFTACVPYAYVLPPVELSVAGDVRLRTAEKPDLPVELRAEVHPLAIPQEQHDRKNDVALGYMGVIGTQPNAPTWQGGLIEYSRVLYMHQRSESALMRVRAGAQARLMYDGRDKLGPGACVRLQLDYSGFVDSDFESSDGNGGLFGHALGEAGFGLYTEIGYVRFPSSDGWTFTIGISGDVPAAAGIGWAYIWSLL